MFLGNRNANFLDNTKKILFQRNFLGEKTIFSDHLGKANTVFCGVKEVGWAYSVLSIVFEN